MASGQTLYAVEWLAPNHGPKGIWYLHYAFKTVGRARRRLKDLRHEFASQGVADTETRIARRTVAQAGQLAAYRYA